MCDCDWEGKPDVYDDIIRKANKHHKCYECAEPINKGDHYLAISGLWDGEWLNYKVCNNCSTLSKHLQEHHECFCWTFGNLYQEICDTDAYDRDDIESLYLEEGEDYDELKHNKFYAHVYRVKQ